MRFRPPSLQAVFVPRKCSQPARRTGSRVPAAGRARTHGLFPHHPSNTRTRVPDLMRTARHCDWRQGCRWLRTPVLVIRISTACSHAEVIAVTMVPCKSVVFVLPFRLLSPPPPPSPATRQVPSPFDVTSIFTATFPSAPHGRGESRSRASAAGQEESPGAWRRGGGAE